MALEHSPATIIEETLSVLETAVNLKSTTPEGNFGCSSSSRSVPLTPFEAERMLTQCHELHPGLYYYGRTLAEDLNISSIVDVSHDDDANDDLVAAIFSSDRFAVTGIDHVFPRSEPRKPISHGRRVECHLGSKRELESAFSTLSQEGPHLIILADVLERLPDPRNLLHSVRDILLRHPDSRLVLSAVDRERLHGAGYLGLPKTPYRMREWTLSELASFLVSCGFTLESAGRVSSHDEDAAQATCLIALSCQAEAYDAFLLNNGLSHTNAAYAALVTSEHATLAVTGGIGTYANYVGRLDHLGIITVYIGSFGEASLDAILGSGWIHPRLFFDENYVAQWPSAEQAWKTTEHLLFFFHRLQVIEYQDYQGLGARIGQAKQSGLISASIRVQVMCHGNQAHVDRANETWSGLSLAQSWLFERVTLETADRVYVPSDYLHDLYREVGYDLGDRVRLQRLPFFYSEDDPFASSEAAKIETLIFFGKLAPLKGIGHFIEAVQALDAAGELSQIKNLVFLGGRIQLEPAWEESLRSLAYRFHVTYLSGKRADALEALARYRNQGLVVMPYLGDNHPYSVLEVIDLGMSFVTYQRGGIPSLIPDTFKPDVLATPTPAGLAHHIRHMLNMSAAMRGRLFHSLRAACAEEQKLINSECLRTQLHVDSSEPAKMESQVVRVRNDLATVIVPVYNTALAYIRDLCLALNVQSVPPHEVVFVNDGSQPGYTESLEAMLTAELSLRWRVIAQENRGLAGARNTGLNACATKYVITLDSDDVPGPDFVYDHVHHLELDPDLWATSTYVRYFHEDKSEDWRISRLDGDWYRPVGESLIYGQVRNFFGTASAAYNVERLRSIGGWDETDKTMWEDWACYLKIVSSGGKVGVVPKLGLLYRVHKNSMLRTYASYPATWRLARNTTILPRWEAYVLQSMMRDYERRSQPQNVHFMSESEQAKLLTEQHTMLAELRQWAGNQSTYISNLERGQAEQRTMLAELRQWTSDQADVIEWQRREIERLDKLLRLPALWQLMLMPLRRMRRVLGLVRRRLFP